MMVRVTRTGLMGRGMGLGWEVGLRG